MVKQEWELQSGLKFNMDVPSSVEEFDSLPGGRAGLCLECGIDDVMYRGPFADVRDQLAEAVQKANPNVVRKTKPHPNPERAKKGETALDESPGKYIARVAAELGVEESTFQPLLDEIMAKNSTLPDTDKEKIKFSVEKVARTGSGGLVGKGDLEMAATLIAQGADKLAISLQKLSTALGRTLTLDGDAAVQQKQLALGLKEYRAILAKQQFAQLVS